MLRALWLFLAAAALIALAGCSKRANYDYAPEPQYYGGSASGGGYYDAPAAAMDVMAEPSRTRSFRGEAKAEAYYDSGDDYSFMEAEEADYRGPDEETGGESPPEQAEAPARMVHYNGWMRLKVTRTEELVEQVAQAVEAAGGYVEQRTLTRITARVPVIAFQDTYDELLTYGDVLDKSLTADDITEAYSAVDLRLQTARTTRERLQELLARATDEEEKLELLRQIQRLTEEIDRVESQLRTLSGLASYSRLTVEGVPRQAFSDRGNRVELDGFGFIQNLSPFRSDVTRSGKLLELAVPEGMVELDLDDHFVAEGPDGALIRSGRLKNEPAGDSMFWIEAVQGRLAEEFQTAEITQVGAYQVLRLVEAGADDPYRYLIAVRAEGRWLDLVEIYYPGEAQEDRYTSAVRMVLGGGAS